MARTTATAPTAMPTLAPIERPPFELELTDPDEVPAVAVGVLVTVLVGGNETIVHVFMASLDSVAVLDPTDVRLAVVAGLRFAAKL
jgi:hypothetical protein